MTPTQSIELTKDTYDKLVATAQEQQIDIELLIQQLLETPEAKEKSDVAHPFAGLIAIAEDLGVDDLAEQHDHYLYGVEKH